jgi:serine protease Do
MIRGSRSLALAALALAVMPAGVRADDDLDDLQEKAIKAAVARVAPCVVQIETSGGTEVVRVGPQGVIRRGFGPTSGLIVSADGYVISSAFNFANKPQAIRVAVPGHKERHVAKVVATDQTRMLTLLKIDLEGGAKLPVPVAAPKTDIKVGYTAIAVGRTLPPTLEQPPSVSVGIISAVDRIWGRAVQTDAKVSPVNYGGPLVDMHGRVIGVLVPASPRADGETAGFEWYDSGIGFAIPLEDVNRVLPKMTKGTEKEPVVLKRGMLGITLRGQDQYGTQPVIEGIAPGSAAEKVGLKAGDLIKEIDGKPVANQSQLMHRLGPKYEGDVVSIKLERDKKDLTLEKVVLAGASAAQGQSFLGILPMRDDPEPGVEVRFVYPQGPADKAGIKVGDRLMKIGPAGGPPGRPVLMKPIAGRDELLNLLATAPVGVSVRLEVKRKAGGKTENVEVKLGEVPDTVPEKLPPESSAKRALAKPGEKKEDKKDKKDEKKIATGLLKRTTAARDHSYWIYVPENYDPNVAHGVVVWLHPPGKNRDKDIDDFVWSWQLPCEDYHLIIVAPKSDNERGWTQGESEFVQEALKTVLDTYTVDRRRIVAHGMGVGGEMAIYLGFHARNQIRGVATVGAALTSNPRDKVANQPLSFFLVAGEKDPLAGPIKESKDKLVEQKYPVIYREIKLLGHQYIDGKLGIDTLNELIRWIDTLDRL